MKSRRPAGTLPTWCADSGGKGIQIISVAHGEAQLRSRWKQDGAQAILDTAGIKVLLPGVTDTGTLATFSKLAGQAAFKERGQDHHSRHDVMTAEMIRPLPEGRALVIRGGLSPVVAKLARAWKATVYKRARRAGTAVAALTAAPPPALTEFPWPAVAAVPDAELEPGGDLLDLPEPDDGDDDTSWPWSA